MAEQLDRRIDALHLNPVSRHDLDAPERRPVAGESALVAGAALQELEGEAGNPLGGAPLQVLDSGKPPPQ